MTASAGFHLHSRDLLDLTRVVGVETLLQRNCKTTGSSIPHALFAQNYKPTPAPDQLLVLKQGRPARFRPDLTNICEP